MLWELPVGAPRSTLGCVVCPCNPQPSWSWAVAHTEKSCYSKRKKCSGCTRSKLKQTVKNISHNNIFMMTIRWIWYNLSVVAVDWRKAFLKQFEMVFQYAINMFIIFDPSNPIWTILRKKHKRLHEFYVWRVFIMLHIYYNHQILKLWFFTEYPNIRRNFM